LAASCTVVVLVFIMVMTMIMIVVSICQNGRDVRLIGLVTAG
jgi:hypothetical protein